MEYRVTECTVESNIGFLSWLRTKDLIVTESGRMMVKHYLGGDRICCIALKLPDRIDLI